MASKLFMEGKQLTGAVGNALKINCKDKDGNKSTVQAELNKLKNEVSEQNKNFEKIEILKEDFIGNIKEGLNITSFNGYRLGNKIIVNVKFSGTITPSAGYSTWLFTIKEQYRPSILQAFPCFINKATSGQQFIASTGSILDNGELSVIFTNTSTNGNTNYPWCTTRGLTISYEL